MSEVAEPNTAQTRPGESLPAVVEKNRAVSLVVPFERVRHLLVRYPPPRRPNRNRPIQQADAALQQELDAWEAASDETLERFDDGLPE